MPGRSVTIAVIIPTFNERTTLPTTLRITRRLGLAECLVVDGGSPDGTAQVAHASAEEAQDSPLTPVRVLSSPAGRAAQMNRGAEATEADVLLFLHADTWLPAETRAVMEDALADPDVVGGRFDVQFTPQTGLNRLIASLMNWRSRWSGIMTGDQGIFVRAEAFRRLGGFAPLPLMEDVELSRRLKRLGKLACLSSRVTTSYRRWEQQGPIWTILRMWTLRLLYWLGVSPQTLVHYYRMVR